MKYDEVMKQVGRSQDIISIVMAIACLCDTLEKFIDEVRATKECMDKFIKKSNIGFYDE